MSNNLIVKNKNIDFSQIEGLKLKIDGDNNKIILHDDIKFINVSIIIQGNNNFVEIGPTKGSIRNTTITFSGNYNNRSVVIGKNFDCGGAFFVLSEPRKSIHIGDNCLFSDGIHIRTDDGHVIYNIYTGEIENKAEHSIEIGNHVWLGRNCYIGKDVKLGDDTVVGFGSIVTKRFRESNVIIAGNPAKIVGKGISWKKESIQSYENQVAFPKIVAIIPARFQSSRFPGKPLAIINGKPMIQWVYEKVEKIEKVSKVYVATDDERIFRCVEDFGGKAIMTGECACGTERVYQACKQMNADIVLNIQGDEPLIKTEMIEELISAFSDNSVKMATLKKEITNLEEVEAPNVVKVITDVKNDAIYFSRSIIPFNRDKKEVGKLFKHIGIYAYTKDFLETYINLEQSNLEMLENLEQLRAIENGYKIRVVETKYESIGVDLPEHIAMVEEAMKWEEN